MRDRAINIKKNRTYKGKQYYKALKYPDISLSSSDLYIKTTIGDRLDSLANQFYNDIRLWWVISSANPHIVRRDSYALKPNLELRIPANISQILKDFENLNK